MGGVSWRKSKLFFSYLGQYQPGKHTSALQDHQERRSEREWDRLGSVLGCHSAQGLSRAPDKVILKAQLHFSGVVYVNILRMTCIFQPYDGLIIN